MKVRFIVPPVLRIPELSRSSAQLPEQWDQNLQTTSPEHTLEFGGRDSPKLLNCQIPIKLWASISNWIVLASILDKIAVIKSSVCVGGEGEACTRF